jgi:hypothetical protein
LPRLSNPLHPLQAAVGELLEEARLEMALPDVSGCGSAKLRRSSTVSPGRQKDDGYPSPGSSLSCSWPSGSIRCANSTVSSVLPEVGWRKKRVSGRVRCVQEIASSGSE